MSRYAPTMMAMTARTPRAGQARPIARRCASLRAAGAGISAVPRGSASRDMPGRPIASVPRPTSTSAAAAPMASDGQAASAGLEPASRITL